jgi:hypothetical protein
MNASCSNPSADQTAPDQARQDDFAGPPVTAAEMAMLEKLARIGAELAVKVAARLDALLAEPMPAEPEAAKEAAQALHKEMREFDRLSRAYRLTIGLKQRAVANLEKWRRSRDEAAADTAQPGKRPEWAAKKHQVGAILEEIVRATQGDKQAGMTLQRTNRWFALRDREAQLPDRPLGELIARIARDFGYKIDWSEWQGQDWAEDAAQAFPPPPPPPPPPRFEHSFVSTVILPDGSGKIVEVGRTIDGQTVLYEEYRSAGAGAEIELSDGTRLRLQVAPNLQGEMEWYSEDSAEDVDVGWAQDPPPRPPTAEPAPPQPGADPPRRDAAPIRNYSVFGHL